MPVKNANRWSDWMEAREKIPYNKPAAMIELNQKDVIDKMASVGLFSGLDEAALEVIYRASRAERKRAGEFFFFQGDVAERIFMLCEGRVKLLQLSTDGQQVILRMGGPWTMIGIIALAPGAHYPVTAEWMEDTLALRWMREDLDDLVQRYPALAQNGMRMMAGHVREFQDRFREMATERVERRLARALLRLASQVGRKSEQGIELQMAVSRQDLAEMSGTTLYSASRLVSEWERRGLVRTGRERITILNPHGLVQVAEELTGS